jgi:membrane-bound metal-dependent hydrolase YbcI (DUF457 family)
VGERTAANLLGARAWTQAGVVEGMGCIVLYKYLTILKVWGIGPISSQGRFANRPFVRLREALHIFLML